MDLYIKDKNPKPPDDVHDIDEIRKLRGNVTRRQARTSSSKRDGSTPSSSKPTPIRDQRSPSAPVFYPNINHADSGPLRTTLNRPSWQATGVINNLPPVNREALSTYNKKRNPARRASVKEDLTRKQDALEERDRGQAAELALREVLGSVRAANLRAHPRQPFEFNWFGESFPAICLRCLSAPISLLSTPTNPSEGAWPTEPPGQDQFQALEKSLELKLSKLKQERDSTTADQQRKPNGVNGHGGQQQPAPEGSEEKAAYIKHLTTVYQTWKALSEKEKQENWRLECQRAFTREREKHKETEFKLDRAEQELQHLRAQLDQRNGSQRPKEFSRFPSATMPLSREALQALSESNDLAGWNYEATILKWKARIQHERSAQQPLPNPPLSAAWPSIPNTGSLTNGTSSYPQAHRNDQRVRRTNAQAAEHDHSDDDEDLADALGDDDEEMSVSNHMTSDALMDRRVLDPDLRDRPDTAMKGAEGTARDADGEGYAGGRMLMGLRDYDSVMSTNGDL